MLSKNDEPIKKNKLNLSVIVLTKQLRGEGFADLDDLDLDSPEGSPKLYHELKR